VYIHIGFTPGYPGAGAVRVRGSALTLILTRTSKCRFIYIGFNPGYPGSEAVRVRRLTQTQTQTLTG